MNASRIFNFLRGSLRGAFGQEDLRARSVLLLGMSPVAQDLLAKLCIEDSNLFFSDPSVQSFYRAHIICGPVKHYQESSVDVVIDFNLKSITIKGKSFPLEEIKNDAYTQGIHVFYLTKKSHGGEYASSTQSDLDSPTEARIPGGNRRDC